MLIASSTLQKVLEKLPDTAAIRQLRQWFTNLVNTQTPSESPAIRLIEEEKVVVLYCNTDLWNMVDKWKHKDLKSMGFLDGMAIWKEIKKIMEKGEKG